MQRAAEADAARFSQPFEPRRGVNPVPEDVAVLDIVLPRWQRVDKPSPGYTG